LHELARAGQEVEREARPVHVARFAVAPSTAETGVHRFEVECSSGTYVRSLVADLGHALGGGAHLRSLRRTRIGSFTVDEAKALDEIVVLPPATALRDYASVTVGADQVVDVGHGKRLRVDGAFVAGGSTEFAVLDLSGRLLAVYERLDDDTAKPAVVLAPATAGSSPPDGQR
jgi:tRNA pseudouridine55 synthase